MRTLNPRSFHSARLVLLSLWLLLGLWPLPGPPARASASTTEPAEELAGRRAAAMRLVPDGLLLLHARSGAKAEDQPGFRQDPSFQYFTGLLQTPDAILVLDGPRRRAHLFLAPPPVSFGQVVEGLGPQPNQAGATQLGLDSIEPWDRFSSWLRDRLGDGNPVLYVDAPRGIESSGSPPELPPVAGVFTLWRAALANAFPAATIRSAVSVLRRLRWIKSATEIATLRANAAATVTALRAVARHIAPGVRQRQTEAVVISACMAAGAQGPSFWPWTMSGPNTRVARLVRAFYSYENLDRIMHEGELIRVDIGCRGGGYGADVGRTLPVSGRFDEAQRELWNLLVDSYLAGLDAMRDGVSVADVQAASRAHVRAAAAGLHSVAARAAAATLDDNAAWHLHGVGIESGEEALATLRSGTVLAYEPMLITNADAMYLEDMILVTDTGHEVLSAGLPYRASEIEALMHER